MTRLRHALAAGLLIASTCGIAACTAGSTGVATAGTVTLDAQKGFLTAQLAFKSLQQIALAGIQSGAIKGTLKAQVIALNDQGQRYENQGYAAETTGVSVAASVAGLTNVVAQLNALGIKGN